MMFRTAALIVGLSLFGGTATAQALPPSCVSATKAKTVYMKHAEHGPVSPADRLFGSDVDMASAQRESAAVSQLNTLARMCIGDLVADHRIEDAAYQALRFGLASDAQALFRQVELTKAKP